MEKRKKMIKRALSVLYVVVALTLLLSVSVSAYDFTTDIDVSAATPSIPLSTIEFENFYDYIIDDLSYKTVVDNPFSIYDTVEPEGKFGWVINYPYEQGSYTNTGRTVWMEFYTAYTQEIQKYISVSSPINVIGGNNNSSINRNIFNALSVTYTFDDFILSSNDNAFFNIVYNPVDSTNTDNLGSSFYLTFDTIRLADDKLSYITSHHEMQQVAVSSLSLSYELFSTFLNNTNDDDLYICNLEIVSHPLVSSDGRWVYSPNDTLYNANTYIDYTLHSDAPLMDLTDWIIQHPVIEYYFTGIGNLSFTEWLEGAVGGFFDFEIVPNLSLGGILIVVVAVGLFMLLIRIFKG